MKKVISIFVICLLFITGCSVKKTSEVTDEEKFAMEYGVSDDNPIKYASIDELEELIKNGNGVIFFGSSNDESSRTVSSFLLDTTKETKIKKIYYCDPTRIKDKNKKKYKNLLTILKEKLELEDLKTIKIPSIYVINNGKISTFEKDSLINQLETNDNLNTNEKEDLKKVYINFLKESKDFE